MRRLLVAGVWVLFLINLFGICFGIETFNKTGQLEYLFDQRSEFPNLFLPEEYRNNKVENIPIEIVSEYEYKLNQAMKSIFKRALFPIYDENENKVISKRYFEYVLGEIKSIDPKAQLIPSGGVVRSGLTYLYDLMYTKGMSLDEIINDHTDINGLDLKGVGSDFDIFVTSRDNFAKVQQKVIEITNSAETAFEMRNSDNKLKRSFFLVADVKNFEKHSVDATSQGGSTIDLLGFDFEKGRFLMPQKYSNIVRDFIYGFFTYLPAGKEVTDLEKQTIRGFRSIMELPWLKVQNKELLKKELSAHLMKLKEGKLPGEKAIEQFAKMVRNSRYYGAHNRFYRAAPNSIDEYFLVYAKALSKKVDKTLLPEFVGTYPLKRERINNLLDKKFMNFDSFRNHYTNDGNVFHGIPSIENASAVIRHGLFVSSSEQGHAAYGKGAYTTNDFEIANSYASRDGLVFKLKINKDARILDWSTLDERIKNDIEASSKEVSMDTFDYLAKFYGVDIVINEHVLIQNSNAIVLNDTLENLLEALYNELLKKDLDVKIKIKKFHEFKLISDFIKITDEHKIPQLKLTQVFTPQRDLLELINLHHLLGNKIEGVESILRAMLEVQKNNDKKGINKIADDVFLRMQNELLYGHNVAKDEIPRMMMDIVVNRIKTSVDLTQDIYELIRRIDGRTSNLYYTPQKDDAGVASFFNYLLDNSSPLSDQEKREIILGIKKYYVMNEPFKINRASSIGNYFKNILSKNPFDKSGIVDVTRIASKAGVPADISVYNDFVKYYKSLKQVPADINLIAISILDNWTSQNVDESIIKELSNAIITNGLDENNLYVLVEKLPRTRNGFKILMELVDPTDEKILTKIDEVFNGSKNWHAHKDPLANYEEFKKRILQRKTEFARGNQNCDAMIRDLLD